MIDSEEEVEQVQIEIDVAVFPSPLPPYVPLRKMNEKPVKYLKDVKYGIFTPLLLESMPFAIEFLGKIPHSWTTILMIGRNIHSSHQINN